MTKPVLQTMRGIERELAAAQGLARWGFTMGDAQGSPLTALQPFAFAGDADQVGFAVGGRIDAAEVTMGLFANTTTDAEGQAQTTHHLVCAARHPRIQGAVAVRDDARAFDAVQAFLDVVLWIPPFTLLKAVQLLNEATNPDRAVGDAEFDRRYLVRAASDDAARSSLPAPFRDLLVRVGFRGWVEIRSGWVIFEVHGTWRSSTEDLERVLGHVAPFVRALAGPEPAYR